MAGLFQGLEIGTRALMAHQTALQTIGHNIANVNTPGYSRQRVRVVAATVSGTKYGPMGVGVDVDDIRHIRDLFITRQFRENQKSLGKWTYKAKTLIQMESMFNEPQDNSLSAHLNDFWNGWSNLSTNSDGSAARSSVLASANQVVNSLNRLAGSLKQQRAAVDNDMNNMIAEVNLLTRELARLNQQISLSELGNTNANDLRDRRDLLIDDLADLIDVNVVEYENGSTKISMGAMAIVDGSDSLEIGQGMTRVGDQVTHHLIWAGSSVRLKNSGGKLAGLVESRDEVIPRYLDQLNELTKTIVEQVNSLHSAAYGLDGSTGINFFDPTFTEAATVRLNPAVQQDINMIAASQSSNGDNLTALALADLRNLDVAADGTMTINEYYNNIVGGLGIETREAASFTSNYELLLQQIENQRQSVQGVSLDEEMTHLIKSQHAFDAAARVITVMDSALDTVISRMGMMAR